MRMLLIALFALGAGVAVAQVARGSNASVDTTGPGGGFGTFDSRNELVSLAVAHNGIGMAYAAADLCAYASTQGLLTGNYFCLKPDGSSQAGGLALTAAGSPTTETNSVCPNGANCASMTGQVLNGTSGMFSTAAVASPTGSFSVCVLLRLDATSANQVVVSKNQEPHATGQAFQLLMNGANIDAYIFKDDATATAITVGAIAPKARHIACVTYEAVADTTSILRGYIDGVAGTPSTVARYPVQSTAQQGWEVGRRNQDGSNLYWAGMVGNAFLTETLLTPAQITALSAAAIPTWTGSYGEAVTFTRATAHSCTAEDGTMTKLPSGRPCITGRAVKARPAVTNALTHSEFPSGVANCAGAQDWTRGVSGLGWLGNAIDTGIDFSDAGQDAYCYKTFAAAGNTTYTISAYVRMADGGVPVFSGAAASNDFSFVVQGKTLPSTDIVVSAQGPNNVQRISQVVNTDGGPNASNNAGIVKFSNNTAATFVHSAVQIEASSYASDYCGPSLASAVTCNAETASVANPLAAAPANPTQWCAGGTLVPAFGAFANLSATVGVVNVGATAGFSGAANTAGLWVTGAGTVVFQVNSAVPATKILTTNAALAYGTHSIFGCNDNGTLSIWVDMVPQAATVSGGGGSGVIATQPATLYIGSLVAGDQASGYVRDWRIIRGVSP